MRRNICFNLFLVSMFFVLCGLMSACTTSQKYPHRPKNRKRCDCPHFSWAQPGSLTETNVATLCMYQK